MRGRASSVDGLVVECPFDEFHTNSGDTSDKASFVMNAGVTDTRGFVWKCHHASCQGRDRLDFLGKAIAEGWFEARLLDMPEYHDGGDPCAQALAASVALRKESSLTETESVFRMAAECDQKLMQAAVLRQIKTGTGMGMGEARAILKEYEQRARADGRQASAKPHFVWLTDGFDQIVADVSKLLVEANKRTLASFAWHRRW